MAQALTLTCGFAAACPSGTGIISGPPGLVWDKHKMQQDNGSKCHIASSSEGWHRNSSYCNPGGCLGLSLPHAQHIPPALQEFILLSDTAGVDVQL